MNNTLKYGDIDPRIGASLSARFLAVAHPLMLAQKWGQPATIRKNKGQVLIWRRYNKLPVATAPLQEGVPPKAIKMTFTDVQVRLKQYGSLQELTDAIVDTHEDPVLQIASERAGEQAAESIDLITFDVLKGGSNVTYAGGKTSRSLVDEAPAGADMRLIERGFARAGAMPIKEMVGPSQNIATVPVDHSYVAVIHTDLEADIRAVSGFKDKITYGSTAALFPGEVGNIGKIRFSSTTQLEPWESAGASTATKLAAGVAPAVAAACDVYPILIFGREAYGIVRLKGLRAAQIIVVDPSKADSSNQLAQVGSVGWKVWYASVILNNNWMARYEVACSATPPAPAAAT